MNKPITHGNLIGQTPLHVAVRWEFTDIVKALIAAGANVDNPITAGNLKGHTPLQMAINYGYTNIENALREAGEKEGHRQSDG